MNEKKVIEILEIDELEFSCVSNNTTLLKVKKDFLIKSLEIMSLEDVIKILATKIFNYKNYFEKQKVVALINVLKTTRLFLNDKDKYKINLVIRNLKAYQDNQKSSFEIHSTKRLNSIFVLINIAFNMSLHNILKTMYKVAQVLLLILNILKKFNYNINITNVKNFVKALAYEINTKEQNELEQVNKVFKEINEKIKENNENKINDFER